MDLPVLISQPSGYWESDPLVSTLLRNIILTGVMRPARIELAFTAWEAVVLPLNDGRLEEIEPISRFAFTGEIRDF